MSFWVYLLVMSGVTYLIRALPLVFMNRTITNRFINSFLYYVPNAILAVMTIPAIFYATGSLAASVGGFAVAMVLAYREKSLLTVAVAACVTVFLLEKLLLR